MNEWVTTAHYRSQQESPVVADKPARRLKSGSLKGFESDTIRQLAYGFLLPFYSNFVSKNAPFSRYRDILVENRRKTYLTLIWRPLSSEPPEISA